MAEALNRTTGGLSVQMQTYYEKVFLARAIQQLVYAEGAQKSTHGKNIGKSIVFTRMTPMSNITSALSEGANPSVVLLAGANVSCTLAEYGNTAKITKFLSLTSIDKNNSQAIDLLGKNMGDSIDRLTGAALSVGGDTALFANSKVASSLASSDTLDAADIREAVEALEINRAPTFSDGFYMGKVGPKVKTSIVKDSTWLAAKEYVDTKDLYRGEMGELYQVRFLMTTQPLSSTGSKASYTDAYLNFFHGRDAFGAYDLNKIGSFCSNAVKKFREFGGTLINKIRQCRAELSLEIKIEGVQTMYGIPQVGKDIVGTIWRHIEMSRNDSFAH